MAPFVNMLRRASLAVSILVPSLVYAQSITVALSQQSNISYFSDYLQQNEDIIELLDGGDFTVLIPTDAAIVAAQSLMPTAFNSSGAIRALLTYHILLDTHPSQSFSNSSVLVPTILQDTSYTNVTGGQRVELVRKDGQPAFLSAVRAESKIVQPDIFYKGGLLHIIDSALQIPLSFPDTITKAGLQYLVALLNQGNWLTPDSIAYKLALETPDLTFIGPNDPKFAAGYAGWNGLTQDELDEIFLYHVIPQLVYTSDMKNNTQFQTMAKLPLVARQFTAGNPQNSVNFLDQAEVTSPNYLTANGVLQIIDRPLDPTQADLNPLWSDVVKALGIVDAPPEPRLSTPVIAGIVVAGIAVLFAIVAGVVLLLKGSRRDKQVTEASHTVESSHTAKEPSELDSKASHFRELDGNASCVKELDGRDPYIKGLDDKTPYVKVYEMSASNRNSSRLNFDHMVRKSLMSSNSKSLSDTSVELSGMSRTPVPKDFI